MTSADRLMGAPETLPQPVGSLGSLMRLRPALRFLEPGHVQPEKSSLSGSIGELPGGLELGSMLCHLDAHDVPSRAPTLTHQPLAAEAKALYRKALALEGLGMDALPIWRQALRQQPHDALLRRKLREAAPWLQTHRATVGLMKDVGTQNLTIYLGI